MSVILAHSVPNAIWNMPSTLNSARMSAPASTPIPKDRMTFLVISASVMATRGGTIVHQPYALSSPPILAMEWSGASCCELRGVLRNV